MLKEYIMTKTFKLSQLASPLTYTENVWNVIVSRCGKY